MSCSVEPRPCPMCSEPVTFGGGSVIPYGTLGLVSSAWKYPLSSQNLSQRGSTSDGSYCLGSAVDADMTARKLPRGARSVSLARGQLLQVLADDLFGELGHD